MADLHRKGHEARPDCSRRHQHRSSSRGGSGNPSNSAVNEYRLRLIQLFLETHLTPYVELSPS